MFYLSNQLYIYIFQGDIVLIGLREFQPDKADIIHKYTPEEARNLQSYGELPANAKINQTAVDMAMEDEEEEEAADFDFSEVSFLIEQYLLVFY